jgi:3-isopropylmalate/(R)-2-methylmalate dehydratase small subunit
LGTRALQPFTTLTGTAIPFGAENVDTDVIIPARFLKTITRTGLGKSAFFTLRTDPDNVFDTPRNAGAPILIAGDNFGCGSSREHAPQAIAKWGIKALVGESFAEIFFGNCVAMGIPCVTAASADLQTLQDWIAAYPAEAITLDLEAMQVRFGASSIPVVMGEGARNMFLGGTWDACGQLVAQGAAIRQTAAKLPYVNWSR